MNSIEYNPSGSDILSVRFICDKCGMHVFSKEISLPVTISFINEDENNYAEVSGFAECYGCDKTFKVFVKYDYGHANVKVEGINIDNIIDIQVDDKTDEYLNEQIDAILGNTEFLNNFNYDIQNLLILCDKSIEIPGLQNTLLKLIYSGAITCLEDYLSSTLINEVLNIDEFYDNFVRSNTSFKTKKIFLSNIIEEHKNLREAVKKELVEITYHNLPMVKEIYRNSLQVDIPPISDLMKIINTRHDMVHRNGKDVDGNIIEISVDKVNHTIEVVRAFANELDAKVKTNRGNKLSA